MLEFATDFKQAVTRPIPESYDDKPSYNEVAPNASNENELNGTEEIRKWFKESINLPSIDGIDYNDKYYRLFINDGFDTFNGIKITDQDLVDMHINKLGHRKQQWQLSIN